MTFGGCPHYPTDDSAHPDRPVLAAAQPSANAAEAVPIRRIRCVKRIEGRYEA
jgi:hypothetical protein